MRLAELMARRRTVGAGLLVTVTERCPLSCAHCSATAGRAGRDLGGPALVRFLRTFEPGCRPDVLMLTGGEPLARPGLVVGAATAARAAGTRTAVLSGAFFAAGMATGAAGSRLPPAVRRVARAVDHFSLSLDAFHEREVARADVFAALESLLREGVATSLHVLGDGPDDPYPEEVAAQVRERFGTDVPLLVGRLRPVGRGAGLRPRPAAPPSPDPWAAAPCDMAAWPVVAADGTLTACCNQDVVDGRARPAHLSLGDIRTSSWPAVAELLGGRPMLRMIRTVGPLHVAARAGSADDGCPAGYCGTCHRLDDSPAARRWARDTGAGPVGELLEAAASRATAAGGPAALVARHGGGRLAHLVDPRRPQERPWEGPLGRPDERPDARHDEGPDARLGERPDPRLGARRGERPPGRRCESGDHTATPLGAAPAADAADPVGSPDAYVARTLRGAHADPGRAGTHAPRWPA